MHRVILIVVMILIGRPAAAQDEVVTGAELRISGEAQMSGTVGHPDYISQLQRWLITQDGAGDFRYLFTDELHAKSFIADLEQALAGGQIISKSVAVLASNYTVPAAGGASTITLKDLPSAENMAVFESGDTIRLRTFSRASGSLTIADAYGVVTAYADQAGGVQNWTFTRNTGADAGGMATSTVIQADAIVLDYGTTGNGYHEVNAIDGLYGVNSPYSQIVTWVTSPIAANLTVRSRLGNLKGITGTTGEYGLIAGTYAATNGQYFRASNSAFELHGIDLSLWEGATRTFYLNRSAPSFAMGSGAPSAYGTGTGCWMGNDGGTYKSRCGVPGGAGYFWDGSTFSVVGAITATSGTIGGWTLQSNQLYSGSGADRVGMLSSHASTIAFYAGDEDPTAAEFRVTAAGALTATSATITGAITATSGSFTGTLTSTAGTIGGWSLQSNHLFAGSGADRVGMLSSHASTVAFYAGDETPASAEFRVTTAGVLTATNAVLNGSLTAGGGDVVINSSGIMISAGTGSTNSVEWTDGSFIHASADIMYISADNSVRLTNGTSSIVWDSNGLSPTTTNRDLGSGVPFRDLYLSNDVYMTSPSTTTAADYPMVYSIANAHLYRKTNGINGNTVCAAGFNSIDFHRGIAVGHTCF